MKKAMIVLISFAAAFLFLITGVVVGRHWNQNSIIVYKSDAGDSHPAVAIQETVSSDAPVSTDGKININTATASQLTNIPGIGDTIAERIVQYREENGPFTALEQLLNVKGIGDSRLKQLKEYVTLGG